MPVSFFNTEEIELRPMIQAFVKHFEDEDLKDKVREKYTGKGFYEGIVVDYPENDTMVVGIGKLDPGAGFPVVEKILPTNEVVYVINGALTCTSDGKSYVAKAGEFLFVSEGSRYCWSSETGCTVLYVASPQPWKKIEQEYAKSIS